MGCPQFGRGSAAEASGSAVSAKRNVRRSVDFIGFNLWIMEGEKLAEQRRPSAS
jgi:hypothetical protein